MITKKRYRFLFFLILTVISLINLATTAVLVLLPQNHNVLNLILSIIFYINGAVIEIIAIKILFKKYFL